MKIIIAIDSLKGSLTSPEAGNAIAEGARKIMPDAEIHVLPLADGGEGTVEALTLGMNGTFTNVSVTGPLGDPVDAVYGILESSGDAPSKNDIGKSNEKAAEKTAIIEMSAAAGITLLAEKDRNPLHTTTYGVGEMILDAIQKGCRHFIVGIGGSATNDGGIGMLQALGYGMLNKEGNPVSPGAKGLRELYRITDEQVIPELKECTFRIACDVTNPLCGKQGCSSVFGPQKGADPAMISEMDRWLAAYAALAKAKYPAADMQYPGTGAAGGLGFAFLTFTNAVLESGIRIILEETRLEEYVKDADIVVTGEGRLDSQTVMGKAPIGVAAIAKKHNRKVIAFSGCVTEDAGICNAHGIDAFFPILRKPSTLAEAMDPEKAEQNMTAAAEQVFRLIKSFQ
ncbi:MAG: glycerate kinase [Eubacteriales bacterium]|nr:glycerate kinase [Eubacteriales bacterium]